MGIISDLVVKPVRKAVAREVSEAAVAAAAKAAERRAPAIVKSASGAAKRAPKPKGYSPADMAVRYPETLPRVPAVDKKTGKPFMAKQTSPEADAVGKVRRAVQQEMNTGDFPRYFDPAQRFHVDPGNYPLVGNTLTDALPAKQATIDQYAARANEPGALGRLNGAYERMEGNPDARHWYAMGQLEKAYVDKYGPEVGRALYRRHFAEGMAASTGGMDPTSNYVMSQYGVFQRRQGLPIPSVGGDLPYPVGGRFLDGNIKQFNRQFHSGQPLTTDNPKRFNFAGNFLGHLDRATLDEQMSNLFEPGLNTPPGDSYGVYEKTVNDLAAKKGAMPAEFQEVSWAGGKNAKDPSYTGMPMIDIVNQAIHRTSRITGLDPDEVINGMIEGTMPTFAKGGSVEAPDYRGLRAEAESKYPFVRWHDPLVVPGEGENYAETWPAGEEGAPGAPRPKSLPLDRVGVEVRRPEFDADGLAAEMLHVDPFAVGTRKALDASLSSAQNKYLHRQALDYNHKDVSWEQAQNNAIDSAMRGYVFGQWPAEANAGMAYNPRQQALLDALKAYTVKGYYPSDYRVR